MSFDVIPIHISQTMSFSVLHGGFDLALVEVGVQGKFFSFRKDQGILILEVKKVEEENFFNEDFTFRI